MSYIEPGDRPVPQFEPQTSDQKPQRRRGGMILVGVLLVIFGFGVWYAYSQGVQRGNTVVPPLIKAEQGPVKVQPDNPGGLQVPNQDKQIYESLGSGGKNQQAERLLPPPEQPRPEQPRAASPANPPNTSPLPALPPPPTAQQQPAPPPVATESPRSVAPPPQQQATAPRSVLPATPAQTPPAAVPTPPPAAQPAHPPTAAPPAPRVAAVPPPAPVTASGGAFRIQLGSLGEANAAEVEWRRLANAYGDVLGGLPHYIERADLGDKGIKFRIQAGGFADRATATAVCDRLRARAPSQGCIVATR